MAVYQNKTKQIFFVLGTIYTLLYSLSCLTPFVHPKYFYGFTFLALLFPFLFAGMLLWLLIVFIFFRNRIWLYVLLLFLGYKNIFSVFSFHSKQPFSEVKQNGTIRLLSWNVKDFTDSQINSDTPGNPRRGIINFIKNSNADIVCIQDYSEFKGPAFYSSITDIKKAGNFSYHIFSIDSETKYPYALHQYGTTIFSKFPIVHSGIINYHPINMQESLAFADLVIGDDTVRIFNTHLQSMYLNFDYLKEGLDGVGEIEIPFLKIHTKAHERIRHYDLKHANQAVFIKSVMDSTKIPFIFCADLNSTPSSYVYHTLQKGLTDAFVSKGYGFGQTYQNISPILRIDVVLMSKSLNPIQYTSPQLHCSDHFPIVTDIQLKQ
jgi:endonuclease/exonuclease/phosphatase family metal-dependent hydrolase